MPLNYDAPRLIRQNLLDAQNGNKPRAVVIGSLTDTQLAAVNEERRTRGMEIISGEVVFVGKHIYESRILRDEYTIDDVIAQIVSAMDAASIVRRSPKMTVLENQTVRHDQYGNNVKDQAVLECTCKFPRAELYSVIPTGDKIRPSELNRALKSDKDRVEAILIKVNNPDGVTRVTSFSSGVDPVD